jgi:mannosyltransferase OCH1-like enzyme
MTLAALRLASTTSVQLIGNILKFFFYLDFWLRPGKRYTIPAVAAPLVQAGTPKRIPRIIWQTNYTNKTTLSVYVNYLFNRMMAPTFEFRLCRDADCDTFIKENFPSEIYEAYSRLQIGAARADLWRVLVLYIHGGIYMDIDAALSWCPDAILNQAELFIRAKDGKLTNYFLACAPGHPILKDIANKIIENITDGSIASVYDMTGPTVVDAVASSAPVRIEPHSLVCRQGQFTKKYFQYPDGVGYWAKEQTKRHIVGKAS